MVLSYGITPVQFKTGKTRPVWHQRAASGVRQIPVTAALDKHYVELLAKLNTDASSGD